MPKAKLSPNEVARITAFLDGWAGAMTWDILAAEVPRVIGRSFSTQTLSRHHPIAHAFGNAKARHRVAEAFMASSVHGASAIAAELNMIPPCAAASSSKALAIGKTGARSEGAPEPQFKLNTAPTNRASGSTTHEITDFLRRRVKVLGEIAHCYRNLQELAVEFQRVDLAVRILNARDTSDVGSGQEDGAIRHMLSEILNEADVSAAICGIEHQRSGPSDPNSWGANSAAGNRP